MLHPLIIPEILETAFQYLDLRELLKCRKVCKTWNNISCQFVGNKALVRIDDVSKLCAFSELISVNATHPLRSFEVSCHMDLDNEQLRYQLNSCGPCFHHVTFTLQDEDCSLPRTTQMLMGLLLTHCPNLTSLTFKHLPSEVLSQRGIFLTSHRSSEIVHPKLPNLRELSIYSDTGYNEDFIASILLNAPRLNWVTAEFGNDPGLFKDAFLSAIFTFSKTLRCLEHLHYFLHGLDYEYDSDWGLNPQDCEQLAKANFPLKSLKFAIEVNMESLIDLLQRYSTTLKMITLRVHQEIELSFMKSLTSIVLYDYTGSLAFMDQCPVLRHLGLCEYAPSEWLTPENIVTQNQHKFLSSLNFYGSQAISDDLFKAIAEIVPSLKTLNLWYINNAKLKTVIESFPLLEDLTISLIDVDDQAFTGFPIDLCEHIERTGNYDFYMEDQATFRKVPHIGNLTNLRRLEMYGACLSDWEWSSVSDVTVYFGLMHLKNLTALSMFHFKWISSSAIKDLCLALPLHSLKLDLHLKMFSESILDDIRTARPDIIIENMTNDLVLNNVRQ